MCENKEDFEQYLSYSNSYYVSGIGLSILHVYLHVYITCIYNNNIIIFQIMSTRIVQRI